LHRVATDGLNAGGVTVDPITHQPAIDPTRQTGRPAVVRAVEQGHADRHAALCRQPQDEAGIIEHVRVDHVEAVLAQQRAKTGGKADQPSPHQVDFAAGRADLVVQFARPARKRANVRAESPPVEAPEDLQRAQLGTAARHARQHVQDLDRLGHVGSGLP